MSRGRADLASCVHKLVRLLNMLTAYHQVTGAANEDQVCEALRRYRDRQCFVREALAHLYNLIADTDEPRPDILKVIYPNGRLVSALAPQKWP